MSNELLQSTDDEMGKMLRGYFQSRMPVFPRSSEIVGERATITLPARTPELNRSRWAMALGVAAVVGVLALLATRTGPQLGANVKDARESSAHKTGFPAIKPPLTTTKTGAAAK
jgi:hypothetical protein